MLTQVNENAGKHGSFYTAVNISFIIIGCIIWSSFVSYWLNPENLPSDSDGNLPPNIMENTHSLYVVMTFVQLTVSLIGVALISEKKHPQSDKSDNIIQEQTSIKQNLNQTQIQQNVSYLLIYSQSKP